MEEVRAFIEGYRGTWQKVMNGTQNVEALTSFFHVPCLMIGVDGVLSEHRNETEIVTFNQSRREAFKAGGATSANLRGVDMQSLGEHLSIAVVNWELMRAEGSLERAWRHYYTIRKTTSGHKILVSTFQVGS